MRIVREINNFKLNNCFIITFSLRTIKVATTLHSTSPDWRKAVIRVAQGTVPCAKREVDILLFNSYYLLIYAESPVGRLGWD